MRQQSLIEPVLVRLGFALAFAIRKSGFSLLRKPQQSPIEPDGTSAGPVGLCFGIRKEEKWLFLIANATATPDRTSTGPIGLCCGVRNKEEWLFLIANATA